MKKNNVVIKGLVVLIVIFLLAIVLALLGTKNTNSPTTPPANNLVEEEKTSEPAPVEIPENLKVRYVSGVITEVKESSIVVADIATRKDVEIGFDSSTRIVKGEGSGEVASETDLETDWNVVIFLLKSSDNNIAQKIQLIPLKQAE